MIPTPFGVYLRGTVVQYELTCPEWKVQYMAGYGGDPSRVPPLRALAAAAYQGAHESLPTALYHQVDFFRQKKSVKWFIRQCVRGLEIYSVGGVPDEVGCVLRRYCLSVPRWGALVHVALGEGEAYEVSKDKIFPSIHKGEMVRKVWRHEVANLPIAADKRVRRAFFQPIYTACVFCSRNISCRTLHDDPAYYYVDIVIPGCQRVYDAFAHAKCLERRAFRCSNCRRKVRSPNMWDLSFSIARIVCAECQTSYVRRDGCTLVYALATARVTGTDSPDGVLEY
jgi:hypothetical protein